EALTFDTIAPTDVITGDTLNKHGPNHKGGARRSISYCMLAVASITPSSKIAKATADGCAVVLKTLDGFLSLRDGPGTRFKVLEKLRQGDVLYIDPVECSTISGKWPVVTHCGHNPG